MIFSVPCDPNLIGDSYCDDECNIEEHEYDGGDCCPEENIKDDYCKKCRCEDPNGATGEFNCS